MAFLNQFAKHFTPQEQETELYKLWSAIGVNTEKALLEEQSKINTEFTDIGNFSEDTIRSWLGFCLAKIPYRNTATCKVTVKLKENYNVTEVPKYEQFVTDDGVVYTQMESLQLSGGESRKIIAVQGKRVVETGTYDGLIKVQANNPDLDYVELKLNGVVIPEVSFTTSYDRLKYMGKWNPSDNYNGDNFILENGYGDKGDFYTVVADGKTRFSEDGIEYDFRVGDVVVYDGEEWTRSFESNRINAQNFTEAYAIPKNGFYVYYADGYLYVKVFPGSDVDSPINSQYELSYISSDGIQGEIKENTLSYASSYNDLDGNEVEFEIENSQSSRARNEPSVGKLNLYLRQRLYGNISISSVPEYRAWFMAQPEVGDCKIISDYERYLESGKVEVTGIVNAYVIDNNGEPLDTDIGIELLDRIEPYKDIALLVIDDFETVDNYVEINFATTTSPELFNQYAKQKVQQYYNLDFCQKKGISLFDDLDLSNVLYDIQENNPYNTSGLTIKGYHYYEIEMNEFSEKNIVFNSFENEDKNDSKYVFIMNDDTELKGIEVITSSGNYEIRLENGTHIGSHVDNIVTMNLNNFDNLKKIECYWGIENKGILSIGKSNAVRKLKNVEVKNG